MLRTRSTCTSVDMYTHDAPATPIHVPPHPKEGLRSRSRSRSASSGRQSRRHKSRSSSQGRAGRGDQDEGDLHSAVVKGDAPGVARLLGRGVDVAAQVRGCTALHAAAGRGHADIVALLLRHDAPVDVTDKDNSTPLQLAARHKHSDCVRLLLAFGANIRAVNEGRGKDVTRLVGLFRSASCRPAVHWYPFPGNALQRAREFVTSAFVLVLFVSVLYGCCIVLVPALVHQFRSLVFEIYARWMRYVLLALCVLFVVAAG